MANVKISDIATTETNLSAVSYIEGERADTTPVRVPTALLGIHRIGSFSAGSNIIDTGTLDLTPYTFVVAVLTGATISASGDILLQLRTVSGVYTSANYDWSERSVSSGAAVSDSRANGGTSVPLNGTGFDPATGSGRVFAARIGIFDPGNASNFTHLEWTASYGFGSGNAGGTDGIACLENTAAVTGLKLSMAAANITAGTLKLYGYR
jgi:hypothetical protein